MRVTSLEVVFALLTIFGYHVFKCLASFLLDLAFQLFEHILTFLMLFVSESSFLVSQVNNFLGNPWPVSGGFTAENDLDCLTYSSAALQHKLINVGWVNRTGVSCIIFKSISFSCSLNSFLVFWSFKASTQNLGNFCFDLKTALTLQKLMI